MDTLPLTMADTASPADAGVVHPCLAGTRWRCPEHAPAIENLPVYPSGSVDSGQRELQFPWENYVASRPLDAREHAACTEVWDLGWPEMTTFDLPGTKWTVRSNPLLAGQLTG